MTAISRANGAHEVSRRRFLSTGSSTVALWGICGPLRRLSAEPGAGSLLLLSRGEAAVIKDAIRRKDPAMMPGAALLREAADESLKRGPWSVTYHRPNGTPAGPHDFFSEGPYWWPDPARPDRPYVRRDGEVNPDRFIDNDRDLAEMSDAILALGSAAWLFGEAQYAARAAEVARVWFIADATRMNPHLEFGQAIRNITTGRGTGIIDTVPLIWAALGLTFLADTGWWSRSDLNAVRQWFTTYLNWLTQSAKGRDERKSGNNHSTWWAAQVTSYALFAGRQKVLDDIWEMYRKDLVPGQMQPDGSCPREEARTKSLGYSSMNLNGFSVLCRAAQQHGVDLWSFGAANGSSLERCVAYLAPYVRNPSAWRKPQITPFDGSGAYFLGLAGVRFGNKEWLGVYSDRARPDSPWPVLVDLLVRSVPKS